jgi:hypothetical protein
MSNIESVQSYYATIARIRYYGQMPEKVEKYDDAVCVSGIESKVFGKDVLTAYWPASLDTAGLQPVNLSHKKEPAHEALANMTLDLDSLCAFTKRWGLLDADTDDKGRLCTRVTQVKPFRGVLQRAWRGEPGALTKMAKDVTARVDVRATGIDIAVVDLWNLIRLLFLRDHEAGRTKVCSNPDCHSPYFLQQRRGQRYCTHKCAVLMNVRRFRKRQAKAKSQTKG